MSRPLELVHSEPWNGLSPTRRARCRSPHSHHHRLSPHSHLRRRRLRLRLRYEPVAWPETAETNRSRLDHASATAKRSV